MCRGCVLAGCSYWLVTSVTYGAAAATSGQVDGGGQIASTSASAAAVALFIGGRSVMSLVVRGAGPGVFCAVGEEGVHVVWLSVSVMCPVSYLCAVCAWARLCVAVVHPLHLFGAA